MRVTLINICQIFIWELLTTFIPTTPEMLQVTQSPEISLKTVPFTDEKGELMEVVYVMAASYK